VVGDLRELPMSDGSFDVVTCGLALTHLPALSPHSRNSHVYCGRGGHLVTSDTHWQSPYLGGIASVVDDSGTDARHPGQPIPPSDYIAAALSADRQSGSAASRCGHRARTRKARFCALEQPGR
jgi:hypothetical protein